MTPYRYRFVKITPRYERQVTVEFSELERWKERSKDVWTRLVQVHTAGLPSVIAFHFNSANRVVTRDEAKVMLRRHLGWRIR